MSDQKRPTDEAADEIESLLEAIVVAVNKAGLALDFSSKKPYKDVLEEISYELSIAYNRSRKRLISELRESAG